MSSQRKKMVLINQKRILKTLVKMCLKLMLKVLTSLSVCIIYNRQKI